MKPVIRPLQLEDYDSCAAVMRRNGLSAMTHEEWNVFWSGYPFAEAFSHAPPGWVIESPGVGLVGTILNIPQMFEWNNRTLRGAVAASWAVDAEWRSMSVGLIARFFGQKEIDLLFNLRASEASARVTAALKAQPLPMADYDTAYFLPVSAAVFAGAAFAKKRLPLPRLLGYAAGPLIQARTFFQRKPVANGYEVRPLDAFDERFDELWRRRPASHRLNAVRTRAALQWRFGKALQNQRLRILGLFSAGELRGYIVLLRTVRRNLGELALNLVADWQVVDSQLEPAALLIDAARQVSRNDNAAALEVRGWCGWKQEAVRRFQPFSTRPSSNRSFVKIPDSRLRKTLVTEAVWDLSPFERF